MGKDNQEVRYSLTKEELINLTTIASKEGAKAYREEMAKERKRQAKDQDKVRKTKKLLSAYRRIKAVIDEDVELTDEEKAEYRWKFLEDMMGSSKEIITKTERAINDKEKKRQENLYCVQCVDNAVRLYKEECDRSPKEEYKRRYREMYDFYIADEVVTIQEIAEKECLSEKTVYKDLDIACGIISVYIFGV